MNPYDEGTPEWLHYENVGEDDGEVPEQFPRVFGLRGGKSYGLQGPDISSFITHVGNTAGTNP